MAEMMTQKEMREAVDLLSKLPPAKPIPIDEDILKETCLCGHRKHVSELQELDTGVFKTIGNVCKGCKRGHLIDSQHARIVCARCKRVIMNMQPYKDPKTGFEFIAGRTYHVTECSLCNPSIEEAKIIEKTLYDRRARKK